MMEISPAPTAPDVNARIAARVRALRASLSMTLEGLAARSDVSRSMLSLIERGESSPTAVVLEKVATGLGVALASLFDAADAAPDPVSRSADRTEWRDPQSGYVRRNISPAGFPAPFRIVDVVLPAGARVAYESGARDTPLHQQIWVREGQLELQLGGVLHRLCEDDCLAMRLDEPVVFHNGTRSAVRYTVIVATERCASSWI